MHEVRSTCSTDGSTEQALSGEPPGPLLFQHPPVRNLSRPAPRPSAHAGGRFRFDASAFSSDCVATAQETVSWIKPGWSRWTWGMGISVQRILGKTQQRYLELCEASRRPLCDSS
jgi:hypothetical protein